MKGHPMKKVQHNARSLVFECKKCGGDKHAEVKFLPPKLTKEEKELIINKAEELVLK